MENFILSTDTCCDEFKSNLKKSRISYIPLNYICNDEIFVDESDSIEDYKFFYDEMKRGKMFSTAGLNQTVVQEYFEGLLKTADKDIVHLTLSSGLSCTYNVVKQVADELNEKSNHKIYVLDSLSATQVQNLVLNYAKFLRDEGKTASEAMEILQDAIMHQQTFFFLSDLDALKRGGRISGVAAAIGKAMQLRPVLTFDKEGKLRVIEKVVGNKKAVRTLLDKFLKLYDTSSSQPIYLIYAGDDNSLQELKALILEKLPNAKIITGLVGPVIASHTGPALTAVAFFSKTERIEAVQD